jgi:hypothetical protein
VPFHGEVRQELLHLLEAHVAQMAFVMKEDEAFDPIEVRWKGEATLREPWVHRTSSIRVRRAGLRARTARPAEVLSAMLGQNSV